MVELLAYTVLIRLDPDPVCRSIQRISDCYFVADHGRLQSHGTSHYNNPKPAHNIVPLINSIIGLEDGPRVRRQSSDHN